MMSLLNLGFKSIGLMRSSRTGKAEAAFKNCNNVAQLRKAGELLKEDVAKSRNLLLLYSLMSSAPLN